jgi:hypothetical protein
LEKASEFFHQLFISYKIPKYMDELVKDMKKIDVVDDSRDDYLSMNSKYIPLLIESKNFHEILPKKDDTKILFVDGGNSILFESASFCIGLVRVGAILYFMNVRASRDSKEFYVLVQIKNKEYSVNTYPKTSFDGLMFNPEDESLREGIEKCSPSKIISVIRKFMEIEFAYENSSDADYILMDGTLEARYPLEDKYLEKLMSTGKVCALSKTCSLVTKNGASIIRKLSEISEMCGIGKSAWCYNPIVKNNNPLHKSEIYFVKLNPKSAYAFRFEIQQGFIGNPEKLIRMLAANSNDPIFLGYPYGLIDVDQYARISDEESRLACTKLSVKMGKNWNEFSKNLTSTNAHTILDKIRF